MRQLTSVFRLATSALLLCATTQAFATIPAEENAALQALYNATGGPTWTTKTNWLGAAGTECTWYGVMCNNTLDHVIGISLWGNNLTGQLPSGLFAPFASLETFAVDSNRLTGPIPALDALTNLQDFGAAHNQLTGPIPSLGNLPNLRAFFVAFNQLTGPIPSLSNQMNLIAFSVDHNQLSGPIPAVPQPTNALVPNNSSLCPNLFDLTPSANDNGWNTATGFTPWWSERNSRCDILFADGFGY